MDSTDAPRDYYFDNAAFVFRRRHGSLGDGPEAILQLTSKTGNLRAPVAKANYPFTPAGEFAGRRCSPVPTQTRSKSPSHAEFKVVEKEYEKVDWQRIEEMIEERIRRNNADIDQRIYNVTTFIETYKNDNDNVLMELAGKDAELERLIGLLEERMKVYVDGRVKEILARLQKHEKRMDDLSARCSALEKALHEMEANLKKYIDGKVDDLMGLIRKLSKRVSEAESKLKGLDRRMGLLEEGVKKQLAEMEEKLEAFAKEQERRMAELEERDRELEDKINDAELQLREELLRHEEMENDKIQELNNRCGQIEVQMGVLESNLKKYVDDKIFIYTQRMEKRLAELDDRDNDLERKINLVDANLRKHVDNRIAELFAHMEEQDKRIAAVEDKNAELAAKLNALRGELKQYISRKVKSVLEVLQERFDLLREELKLFKDQLRNELQDHMKDTKDKLTIVHNALEDLKRQNMNLETALGVLETRITRYLEERLQATEELVEKRLGSFRETIETVQAKLDLKIKAHESYVNSRLDDKDKTVEELAKYIVQAEKMLKELNEKLAGEMREKFAKLDNRVHDLSATVNSLNGSLETVESDQERLNDVVKAEHAGRIERMEVFVVNHEKYAKKDLKIENILDSYKSDIHLMKDHINVLGKEIDRLKGLNVVNKKSCQSNKVNVKELDARVKNIGDNMRNMGSSVRNNAENLRGKIVDLEEKTERNEFSLTNLLESDHRKAKTRKEKPDAPTNLKSLKASERSVASLHKGSEGDVNSEDVREKQLSKFKP
eukprot:TRINITY_DN9435_c0_g1_i12.p1 TRINITY_DN9435_c0_g1~~TRINITY_DN9435_c0_g1_i12.p1  ORF type:complete len:779 (-),score=270.06 TRINITY_DN9435_c0_g1_i12:60-2396(-)